MFVHSDTRIAVAIRSSDNNPFIAKKTNPFSFYKCIESKYILILTCYTYIKSSALQIQLAISLHKLFLLPKVHSFILGGPNQVDLFMLLIYTVI